MCKNHTQTLVNNVKQVYDSNPNPSFGRDSHVQQVAPGRHPVSARKSNIDQISKIATWNVRTLHQKGKLENFIKEMDRINFSILGLTEIDDQTEELKSHTTHLLNELIALICLNLDLMLMETEAPEQRSVTFEDSRRVVAIAVISAGLVCLVVIIACTVLISHRRRRKRKESCSDTIDTNNCNRFFRYTSLPNFPPPLTLYEGMKRPPPSTSLWPTAKTQGLVNFPVYEI
ncbi:craniofacial development protein 2-like [Plakobranchus ocellatus]|uniref:Craniofacial development protein 2-like n=1 Tax=Plakobranchus ocellatus TaxID=259542 RepID=A0AAV4C103_9GAST|nr:craniofacial development protein 2-like [Plakobranchus ocellatus]